MLIICRAAYCLAVCLWWVLSGYRKFLGQIFGDLLPERLPPVCVSDYLFLVAAAVFLISRPGGVLIELHATSTVSDILAILPLISYAIAAAGLLTFRIAAAILKSKFIR